MRALWCLLIVTGLAACRSHDNDQEVTPTVAVETRLVTRDSVADQIQMIGRLATPPGGSAVLTAPAAGVVGAIRGSVGSRVERGEVVITLDVPELEASARQLAAAADLAEREASRQQGLLSEGIAARKQADQASADAVSSRAAAKAAEQLLARTRVSTPIAGLIQQVSVQPGERVEAGAVLARIIAPGELELDADVGNGILSRLHPGLSARVKADGDTAWLPAVIRAVAPAVDSATNTGQVIVRLRDARGNRPGAGAQAIVTLGGRRSALLVPETAVARVGDSLVVFTVGADSLAHQHTVRLGVRAAGLVEVTGDLQSGDRVVATGSAGLTDGIRVTAASDSAH
jgi:membrane fusion protein (multidrug efflux system)